MLVVATGIPFPLLLKLVIDAVSNKKGSINLGTTCIFFLVLVISQLVFNFILSVCSSRWSQSIAYNLRNRIYKSRINSDVNALSNENDMAQTAIISDCEVISNTFQTFFITAISSFISFFAYAAILLSLNLYLFFATIVIIPIFLLLNLKLSNISKRFFSKIQMLKDSILTLLLNTASGFTFIKLYGIQPLFFSKFNSSNKKMTNTSIYFNTIVTFINSMVSFLEAVTPFFILLIGGMLIANGKSNLGNIIACYSYSAALFIPVSQFVGLLPLYKEFDLSCSRVNTLLQKQDDETYTPVVSNLGKKTLVVDNLSVSYGSNLVIKSMNKSFFKERVYLLQGANASGKSTFAKAVAGLIKPIAGTVLVSMGEKISYVPQDTFLFNGSILFNMTIGLERYDKEYLEKLLELTSLNKDLASSNMTLNSYVNNNQHSLSTGQVQKIKLVHALLSEPTILIIDEILNNMDLCSQEKILNYLQEWKRNKTLILISHSTKEIKKILSVETIKFPFN